MAGAVFISYAHKDADWSERIVSALRFLEVHNDVQIWADDRIDAGLKWFSDVRAAIKRADLALLLLSEHFLASDFIAKQEVPELLRRDEVEGMKLIPLLVHDCGWGAVRWLRQIQIVTPQDTALDNLEPTEQNTFLGRLAEQVIDDLAKRKSGAAPVPTGEAAVPGPSPDIDISHLPETSAALFGRDAAAADPLPRRVFAPGRRPCAGVAVHAPGRLQTDPPVIPIAVSRPIAANRRPSTRPMRSCAISPAPRRACANDSRADADQKSKIKNHYCPVTSRIIAIGYVPPQ